MVQDDWNQGFVTGFVAGLSTPGPSGNMVVVDVQLIPANEVFPFAQSICIEDTIIDCTLTPTDS